MMVKGRLEIYNTGQVKKSFIIEMAANTIILKIDISKILTFGA